MECCGGVLKCHDGRREIAGLQVDAAEVQLDLRGQWHDGLNAGVFQRGHHEVACDVEFAQKCVDARALNRVVTDHVRLSTFERVFLGQTECLDRVECPAAFFERECLGAEHVREILGLEIRKSSFLEPIEDLEDLVPVLQFSVAPGLAHHREVLFARVPQFFAQFE